MTQKTILCYGDSNTWGYVPIADHTNQKQRYPRNIRWPGVLQALLGEQYYVVEEGLNSRTTNVDYASPPERNGKTYLPPCLYSHAPIDLVVLALGGNDTKTYFNRSAQDIKNGLADLVDVIQQSEYGPNMQAAPQVLLLSDVIPMAKVEEAIDDEGVKFMQGGVAKAEALNALLPLLAKEKNCHFLALENVLPSPIDGVHYDEAAHRSCAEQVSRKIIAIG